MNPTITITLKQYDQNGHIRILTVPFCLVDTGASSSYITHDCLPTQMKTNKLSSPEIVGNAFSDKITSINEILTANLIIDQHDIEISKVKFYVIRKPMTYKAIIGMNVLSNFQIDFRKDDLVFLNYLLHSERQEISTIIFESDRDHESLDILSNKRITLSPHSDRLLYVKIFGPKWPKEKFIFFPNERLTENNIFVLEHRLFARDHMVQVQNRSNSVLIIELHTRLGCIRKPSKHHNLNFLLTEKELEPYERLTHKKELKEWRIKRDLLVKHNPLDKEIEVLCKLAPKQYQKELSDILHKHSWSFSRGVSDAGLSQHFLTELKLKDTDAPVYTRPYKLDISMQEKVEKKLNELKEAGIIEPSCSAWNSPVLFVKKKDDSIRVVNNYSACGDRSVNSRLIIPKYPSLPIRSVLAKVSLAITTLKQKFPHDKVYFIGLDVRNAFYSISIREKSRDITSFLFGGEQFRYQRMSQGLSSSPATFQYFINKIMAGTEGMNAQYFLINYLDDFFVIVPERYHNKCVDCLLARMADQNLVLALQKSEFYKTECKFLGFLITERGIKAEDMKVKALLELDYPKNLKEGQRSQGALNYYSRLIPNMSAYLKPLSLEICKGKAFTLNDEIIKGINKLRDEIKKGVSVDHLTYPTGEDGYFLFLAADTSLTKSGSIIGNLKRTGDVINLPTHVDIQ